MKYQIQKAVVDIGLKVIFVSVEGVDNVGRNPEWETERKERLEKLQRRYEGMEIRQVNKTKVDESVSNILYIIEGNEATEDAFLSKVMQKIIDTTVRYCGGSGKVFSPDILL